jgi:hypothetical protein
MKRTRRFSHRTLGKLALLSWGALLATAASGGCQTQTVPTSLRALDRTGRVSFVCLSAPGTAPSVALPVERCTATRFESPGDFGVVDGQTTRPHLYALVTQTTRGEIAVIDMSTKVDALLDQNPRVPGATFLPIGSQPVDIASTPGGTATFVGVAEVGREGIFALPSENLRLCETCEPQTVSSWPACALPGAPGEMAVVFDPPDADDNVRATCEGAFASVREPESDQEGGYLVDLTREGLGRPKIVVTVPDLGAIAVVDAQALFDVERDADGRPVDADGVPSEDSKKPPARRYPVGAWEKCPIERWVPLVVDLPAITPPPPPQGVACVNPAPPAPQPSVAWSSRPAGIALSPEKLYVADLEAPVVHVLDMATPCEPIEREPLLPTSISDPTRVVTTSQLAVSPTLTGTLDRYLYVVDEADGSLMVFDVGEGAPSRQPLLRPHPEWTPSQAPDRVEFGVPVQDLVVIERDVPQQIPATGVAPEGVRCNPDPDLKTCSIETTSCDPETLYRTGSNFDTGARPGLMRGAFAYVVLGTGQIAVIDIDDYDAACRAPSRYTSLYGCPPIGFPSPVEGPTDALVSSGEATCNVVIPHTPRSANFMRSSDRTGQNQPGLSGFPLLYDHQGSLQANVDPDGPLLRATRPVLPEGEEALPPEHFTVAVGSSVRIIDQKTGQTTNAGELEHTMVMNLEDPRAHSFSQLFSIVYEGPIPGFSGKAGRLDFDSADPTLSDAASRFCDQGVLGQEAWREILAAEDPADPQVEQKAARFADYVQILSNVPRDDDPHWDSPEVAKECSYQECRLTFGPSEVPTDRRDITIAEAYQDRLVLGTTRGRITDPNNPNATIPVPSSLIECCFPTLVGFSVRVGGQWAVIGEGSGFLHHVIPTPSENASNPDLVGACRNSCDPLAERRNARIRSVPHGAAVRDGEEGAFINPFFRLAINEPADGSPFDSAPGTPEKPNPNNTPIRGTFFQFGTQGTFRPLIVNLAAQTTEIQLQSITFLSATGEIALTDGSLEGLILMRAGSLSISRQYY